MNLYEFAHAFKEVEDTFGKYPKAKVDRIYEYTKHLSKAEWKSVLNALIDADKKPGVQDFKAKAAGYKVQRQAETQTEYDYTCKVCLDGGLLEVWPPEYEKTVFMRCPCVVGKNQSSDLPLYLKKYHESDQWRLKAQAQFLKDWTPRPGEGSPFARITEIQARWAEKIEESKEFEKMLKEIF